MMAGLRKVIRRNWHCLPDPVNAVENTLMIAISAVVQLGIE